MMPDQIPTGRQQQSSGSSGKTGEQKIIFLNFYLN
jgi:hypothetical protein